MVSNDLEQYVRRNSTKISNFKVINKLFKSELKTPLLTIVRRKILHSSQYLTLIIAILLVSQNSDGVQQILVKFMNYKPKRLVFSARKSLKNNPDRIYINEDLTHQNYAIFRALRSLQKFGRIYSSWSVNGKTFAKVYETSSPVRLAQMDDIESCLSITRQCVQLANKSLTLSLPKKQIDHRHLSVAVLLKNQVQNRTTYTVKPQ